MKKVLGLILELNPFHLGHKYFIDKVIEEIKPDLTVAIISSSFTMRADVSILDKFEKTKLCLENKIDLILELPFIYGVNSSDYFAYNSVKILNEVKITHLAFGSEIGNIDDLQKIVKLTDSSEYNALIQSELKKGQAYKQAALKALMQITNDQNLITNYSLPNNTLAISYLKAINQINPNIIPYTIKRLDNQYYDTMVNENSLASATSLRLLVSENKKIDDYIPNYQYDFVNEEKANEKLYLLFKYQLLNTNNFDSIINISEGIEKRLLSFINEKDYKSYLRNTVTKRYSLNRIKRLILHIILQSDKTLLEESNDVYLRVLGLNSKGINFIKKLNNKNIIMNTKDALDNSPLKIKAILEKELKVTRIYELLSEKEIYKNEFILMVKKDDN